MTSRGTAALCSYNSPHCSLLTRPRNNNQPNPNTGPHAAAGHGQSAPAAAGGRRQQVQVRFALSRSCSRADGGGVTHASAPAAALQRATWHRPITHTTRTQNTPQTKKNRGLLGTCLTVAREEGAASLWKGLEPGLHRQVINGGLRIGLYEPVKTAFVGKDHVGEVCCRLLCCAVLCCVVVVLLVAAAANIAQNTPTHPHPPPNKQTPNAKNKKKVPLHLKIASGLTTGAIGITFASPTDLVKVRRARGGLIACPLRESGAVLTLRPPPPLFSKPPSPTLINHKKTQRCACRARASSRRACRKSTPARLRRTASSRGEW